MQCRPLIGIPVRCFFDGINGSDRREAGLEAMLFAAHPVVPSCEVLQSSQNKFFETFPEHRQEADWSVCSGVGIVFFILFRDGQNLGRFPFVAEVGEFQAGIECVEKVRSQFTVQ